MEAKVRRLEKLGELARVGICIVNPDTIFVVASGAWSGPGLANGDAEVAAGRHEVWRVRV